jgi:hypothetical protein
MRRRHQIDLTSVIRTETSPRADDAVLIVSNHSRFPCRRPLVVSA